MAEIEDRLFVALAKKVGYPAQSELRRCRELQLGRWKREGSRASLFATAISEGVVGVDQAHRFLRWADQVARRDAAPLVDAEPKAESGSREFHKSAADFQVPILCETCEVVLDDDAIRDGHAREVGGQRLCNRCSPPAGAKVPSTPRAPAAAARVPSAGRVPAPPQPPRRGRVRAALSKSAEIMISRFRAPKNLPPASDAANPAPAAAPAKPRRRVRDILGESAELVIRPLRRRGPKVGGSETAPVSRTAAFVALGIAVLASLAAIGIAIAVKNRQKEEVVVVPEGEKPQEKLPEKLPEKPPEKLPEKPVESTAEQAMRVVSEAERFEREGREPQAIAHLDAALARFGDRAGAADLLASSREGMLIRSRARIAADAVDVEKLAWQGRLAEAKAIIARLREHLHPVLQGDLDAAIQRVNASIAARWKKRQSEEAAHANEGAQVARREERERFGRAHEALDLALAALDLPAAQAALDRAGKVTDADVGLEVAIDLKRKDAIEHLLDCARVAFRQDMWKPVDLECKKGRLTGKLVKFNADKLGVTPSGSSLREAALADLALDTLLKAARRGAGSELPAYFFGRGVLLQVSGDRKGAIEALGQATAAEASTLRARLQAEEALAQGGGATTSTGPETPPAPETPPEPPRLGGNDDEPKRVKTWMDDTSGSVPWSQAWVIETPHYIIKSNIQKKYGERYVRIMESLADRYTEIFGFDGNDFNYKKNELIIYHDQAEFMSREGQAEYIGGFYEPSSKRIKTFHGPWGNRNTTTLSILAHEATHQFQNLVLREMDHAPVFIIEGLATFFEATEVKDSGEVIVGKIPEDRLHGLQREIRSGESFHLRDVIRTARPNFTGDHYAHAWGMIHWMMYGPEKKKAQKLLDWYWETCKTRATEADDFEEGLSKMGYSIEKLEKAWKDWILALDPKKDPVDLLRKKKK